jgi:Ca-activated chloride channel family protein
MPDLSAFHFLRPPWLLALAPIAVFVILTRVRADPARQWRGTIAPHLLAHLRVGIAGRAWFRPLHLIAVFGFLTALAAAGPTWEREASPFTEDTAPLVVALDVSRTMNAVDVQPTRLERAKQKVRDLLERRAGARTALVAYAGTAHTVLPLADDPSVFEAFLASLETDVMPVSGQNPAAALAVAASLLDRDDVPGSVLFLTDHIDAEEVGAFVDHQERTDDAVLMLAVGTTEGGAVRTGDGRLATDAQGRPVLATLEREGFERLQRDAGVFVASVTVDDADITRVQRRVESHRQQVRQQDESARWRDAGYYLVYPVALLAAFWFRKGWTLRWARWVALVAVLPLGGCVSGASGISETWFLDLWLTPDQQGRRLYERGAFGPAAERFDDPLWRGVAFYQAGALEQALAELARVDSPEALFNAGNASARLGLYDEAVASYDAALADRPDWTEARENRDLVAALLEVEADDDLPPPTGEPSFDADQVEFDEQGERGEVEAAAMTDDQLQEMWMRRLQTTPADFLRARFASEVAESEQAAGEEAEPR